MLTIYLLVVLSNYSYKNRRYIIILLIRPHHVNCIFFFKGKGYNFEFASNMNKIISELKTNQDTKIKLITECDSLCSHCPNRLENDKCFFNDKVKLLDYNTLQSYDLKDLKEYSFKEIVNNIYKTYDHKKFEFICSNCEWFKKGVCSKELINEHKKIWFKE